MIFLLSLPGSEWTTIIFVIIVALLLLPRLFPPRDLQNSKTPTAEIILASLLLISFFLPWISWGVFVANLTVKGYEIPSKIKELLTTADMFSTTDNDAIMAVYASYLLYCIPIFSFAAIVLGVSKKNRDSNYVSRIASVIPTLIGIIFILLVTVGNKNGNDILKYLDVGFYLTMIFGIALWISAIKSGRNKILDAEVKYSNTTHINQESSNDKSELLSQLAQLHLLKEKEVLTEEIYEQERQAILAKLQKQNVAENIIQTEVPVENTSPPEEYNPEYEELFGKETWFKRNKAWVIIFIIAIVASIGIYFLNEASKTNEEKIVGLWSVEFNEVSLDSLNKKEKDNFLDFKKNITVMFYDFKQDSTMNIDMRFIDKDKNQETNGTYKFSSDKTKLEIHLNNENSAEEYEIVDLSSKKMLLKINKIILPLKKL